LGHIHTKIDLNSCEFVQDCYVSDELLAWLKNSCIKTKDGEDLVCYHGSPSNEKFAVFNDNTSYGCKSFIGFFSLNHEFAECYTDDGKDTSYNRVRSFAINSKKLFDIKNPACVRFLKARLPDTIICCGDGLDKASFIDYLRTEQVQVNNYKLTTDKFANLKIFDRIGTSVLGDAGWEHSCGLERDKQLNSTYFLNTDSKSNSVYVLDHYFGRIKPNIDNSYFNKATEGMYLGYLGVPFNKAINTGLLTTAHLNSLSKGEPIHIEASAEEFIDICSFEFLAGPKEPTEKEKQKLKAMIHDPLYSNLDLSVNVTLAPKRISLDEFNQGLVGGISLKKTDNTWEIYENSFCIVNDQKIHILDWLKNEGFDAVVVKEAWAVNIICLYKNMIKDLNNKMPTDSDNVYEGYHYSDALLIDVL
jgi:hypothetical protein